MHKLLRYKKLLLAHSPAVRSILFNHLCVRVTSVRTASCKLLAPRALPTSISPIMALTEPSDEQIKQLFRNIEQHFPSNNLGTKGWAILMISALTTGGLTEHASTLYLHLLAQAGPSKPEVAQETVRRLREALFKLVSVIGVPKPLESVFSIAAVEEDENKDFTFTRRDWKSGLENQARGRAWLNQLYKANHGAIQNTLSAHQDFDWQSIEITYGLYLSDHSILDAVETELVVLTGIMMQNLKLETGWHLRGMRRIGISAADLEKIQQCIVMVATACGLKLTKVPQVADIEHEV